MFERLRWVALAALVPVAALAMVACGGDGDDGEDEPTRVPTVDVAGGDPAAGSCSVTIAGDERLTIQGNGGDAAVASNHWYGAAEAQLSTLLLNCIDRVDRGRSVVLAPSSSTTLEDVPLGPGTYAIPKSSAGFDAGEFRAMVNTGSAQYSVSTAGVLEITKFDATGIEGEFSFVAEQLQASGEPKEISVTGRFEFACTGGEKCER